MHDVHPRDVRRERLPQLAAALDTWWVVREGGVLYWGEGGAGRQAGDGWACLRVGGWLWGKDAEGPGQGRVRM